MNSYCDIPEFYCEQRVKARKPHKCCETGRTIERGEFYWRISAKWDGDVRSLAQSESAYLLCRHINWTRFKDCVIPFEGLDEYMIESDSTVDRLLYANAGASVTADWIWYWAGDEETPPSPHQESRR